MSEKKDIITFLRQTGEDEFLAKRELPNGECGIGTLRKPKEGQPLTGEVLHMQQIEGPKYEVT